MLDILRAMLISVVRHDCVILCRTQCSDTRYKGFQHTQASVERNPSNLDVTLLTKKKDEKPFAHHIAIFKPLGYLAPSRLGWLRLPNFEAFW